MSVNMRPERLVAVLAISLAVAGLLLPFKVSAATPVDTTPQAVTIPSLPYPQSGLRKRLASMGKPVPPVDESLQDDIPGQYFPPQDDDAKNIGQHPAVVALPDCDGGFPDNWVRILQSHGMGVLLISPNEAHPSQAYCSEGSLEAPKHGLTYWAFDAISALHYLVGMDGIDSERVAIFGYGYGAGAAQLAIYRKGHAKHFDHHFKTLVGLRPQCMSEMDNFVPSLLIGLKDDPFNPPAWCHWRMDRDLLPGRSNVSFEVIESGEIIEKQATRRTLSVESSAVIVTMVTEFLSKMGMAGDSTRN